MVFYRIIFAYSKSERPDKSDQNVVKFSDLSTELKMYLWDIYALIRVGKAMRTKSRAIIFGPASSLQTECL